MQRGLSLYLDLLRFALALTVMLGHASEPGYVGRFAQVSVFPQYGLTAVMGFFVLSGFVIAHVSQGKEREPRSYFAARAARMYSVVLPALLLTAVLGFVGPMIDPDPYVHGPIRLGAHQPERYLLTAVFAQDFWVWRREMTPGVNHPFWSLSYEVTYYLLFGLTLVPWRRAAAAALALLLLLSGPKILALFPIWLFGVLAYHALRRFTPPAWLGALLLIATLAGLYSVGAARGHDDPVDRYSLDYLEGLLFMANIIGAGGLAPVLERVLGACPRLIRWLGMLTFALYLCHRPLMYFFSALAVDRPASAPQILWLFGMTFLGVVGVAYLGEWLRGLIRRRLTAGPPRHPPDRAARAATPASPLESSSDTTAPR